MKMNESVKERVKVVPKDGKYYSIVRDLAYDEFITKTTNSSVYFYDKEVVGDILISIYLDNSNNELDLKIPYVDVLFEIRVEGNPEIYGGDPVHLLSKEELRQVTDITDLNELICKSNMTNKGMLNKYILNINITYDESDNEKLKTNMTFEENDVFILDSIKDSNGKWLLEKFIPAVESALNELLNKVAKGEAIKVISKNDIIEEDVDKPSWITISKYDNNSVSIDFVNAKHEVTSRLFADGELAKAIDFINTINTSSKEIINKGAQLLKRLFNRTED